MSEEKQYPSIPQQGKNLAKFAWDVMKESIFNGTALHVSDEIYNERLDICKKCDWYDPEQNRCKECGCFLGEKARWSLDSCPVGKWSSNSDTFVNEKFDKIVQELSNTLDNKEETN